MIKNRAGSFHATIFTYVSNKKIILLASLYLERRNLACSCLFPCSQSAIISRSLRYLSIFFLERLLLTFLQKSKNAPIGGAIIKVFVSLFRHSNYMFRG